MNFSRSNVRKINTISTDVSTLLTRVSAARALLFDNLDNANLLLIPDLSAFTPTVQGYLNNANLSTIPNISTLNATNISYLNNIANSNLLTVPNMTNFPPAVQAYLNNANLQSIPRLVNFTSTRQVYVDAPITSRAASATALSTATWTAARAAHLDHVTKTVHTVSIPITTTNNTLDLSGFGGTATLIKAWVQAQAQGMSNVAMDVKVDVFIDNTERVSDQHILSHAYAGESFGMINVDITAWWTMASHTCKVNYDLTGGAGTYNARYSATLFVTYSIT